MYVRMCVCRGGGMSVCGVACYANWWAAWGGMIQACYTPSRQSWGLKRPTCRLPDKAPSLSLSCLPARPPLHTLTLAAAPAMIGEAQTVVLHVAAAGEK